MSICSYLASVKLLLRSCVAHVQLASHSAATSLGSTYHLRIPPPSPPPHPSSNSPSPPPPLPSPPLTTPIPSASYDFNKNWVPGEREAQLTWNRLIFRGCHQGPGAGDFPRPLWTWSPATFHRKTEEKDNQKKSVAVWFSAYLLATRNLSDNPAKIFINANFMLKKTVKMPQHQ